MKETYFECVFKFEGEKYRTEGERLSQFEQGFWIDDWWEYTTSPEESKYWIPPTKIQHVEKKTRTIRNAKVQ